TMDDEVLRRLQDGAGATRPEAAPSLASDAERGAAAPAGPSGHRLPEGEGARAPDDPWIETRSGRAFSLSAPRAEDVDFENDVAPTLAGIFRFLNTGADAPFGVPAHFDNLGDLAWRRRISLAHHSIAGARRMERVAGPWSALAFLLHDAHEAYVGDIPAPAKAAIRAAAMAAGATADPIKAVTDRIDTAIREAVGLPADFGESWYAAMIAPVDYQLYLDERERLFGDRPAPRPLAPHLWSPSPHVAARSVGCSSDWFDAADVADNAAGAWCDYLRDLRKKCGLAS
ncbi:MAG: hypothetical protein KGQ28_08565, partial [Hyphomicrobiales bacterium]|nr:hypothetical protein [Hyphomicrobiales bacterium]